MSLQSCSHVNAFMVLTKADHLFIYPAKYQKNNTKPNTINKQTQHINIYIYNLI